MPSDVHNPPADLLKPQLPSGRWSPRDFIAAGSLFLVSAAVVLWQNAHLTVLWDSSYILDSAVRISLGQLPYRDFPFAHAPLTFLIQAAIIRLTGRVFFHHVLYANVAGGVGTVLAWRIALHLLRGRVQAAWPVSLMLAAPLTVLGIYSILPFPSYDCDCILSVLCAILLLLRLPAKEASELSSTHAFMRSFLAGAALVLPLFFKQNIGLPFLLAALAIVSALLALQLLRRSKASSDSPCARDLATVLAGAFVALLAAVTVLQLTVGLGNYIHWTIRFASERRLPGVKEMLAVYAEPSLLWWLPCVAVGMLLLRSRFAKGLWARLVALGLCTAPFLWTSFSLYLSTDSDDRAGSLLVLWPLLLVLAGLLALVNLRRDPTLRGLVPWLLLAAINGTLLSQQLWGSTYAIWPLLILLIAAMLVIVDGFKPRRAAPGPLTTVLAAIVATTLLLCGGLYTASEERLSYAQIPESDLVRSQIPELKGMVVAGQYLPAFEELLQFAANSIPRSDGLILMPGEDPFYFATGRVPQFPVLLFDPATDPYSPTQLVEEASARNIRWLIIKRDLQLKEDPTPQREAAIKALRQIFAPYRRLSAYDIYRRP